MLHIQIKLFLYIAFIVSTHFTDDVNIEKFKNIENSLVDLNVDFTLTSPVTGDPRPPRLKIKV